MHNWRAPILWIAMTVLGGAAAMAQTLEPIDFSSAGSETGSAEDDAVLAASAPAAPTNLQAEAVSSTEVILLWQDNANNETEYLVEGRTASDTAFTEIGTTTKPNVIAAFVGRLDPGTTYLFRVRAHNATGNSGYSNVATVTTLTSDNCIPSATAMCLNANRFRVQAMYLTPQGLNGQARTVKLTDDSGYLWFFAATNIEAVVKVLNACTTATGNRYWVFAGGLTNVRVLLVVTDTGVTPTQSRAYVNPQNRAFLPIQDTSAFATCP
jgi:hypothetical protein